MTLIIDEEGKRSKADWVNNFTIVAAMIEALAEKMPTEWRGAANGVAGLNADQKVIQTALNAEQLDGSTKEQLLDLVLLKANTVGGWLRNTGTESRADFNSADYVSGDAGLPAKGIGDLAQVVAALIKDLKAVGALKA